MKRRSFMRGLFGIFAIKDTSTQGIGVIDIKALIEKKEMKLYYGCDFNTRLFYLNGQPLRDYDIWYIIACKRPNRTVIGAVLRVEDYSYQKERIDGLVKLTGWKIGKMRWELVSESSPTPSLCWSGSPSPSWSSIYDC